MPATVSVAPECVAPPQSACSWCSGAGWEPDVEDWTPCFECSGVGVVPVAFSLGRTHSFKTRSAAYDPARNLLTITRNKRTQTYTVQEFAGDGEYGRCFAVARADGEIRRLQCGRAGVSCDCGGETYRSTAKANERAAERGDPVYRSFGCVHLDACLPLLRAGYLDLEPVSVPCVSPESDPFT